MYLNIEVDDIDSIYSDLKKKGVSIKIDIRNEPWGNRHFAIEDPNGIGIDIVKYTPIHDQIALKTLNLNNIKSVKILIQLLQKQQNEIRDFLFSDLSKMKLLKADLSIYKPNYEKTIAVCF